MPAKYNNNNNESLCEFHEVHLKQSSSVAQPSKHHSSSNKIVKESRRLMPKQRITAWSSSSSLSSLTTDSLFSLSDSPSTSMKYKTTGILFGNLDLVPFDSKIDPEPYACYNCWHFDHEYQDCPDIKLKNYCQNCGRRGVVMKECPRCARAYMDYLDRSLKHREVFVSRMEVEKPMDDVQSNIVEENYHESWDDYVQDDQKSPRENFSDSWQKSETGYQHGDWDNHQSPRANSIKKSSKLFSLNATKAEVAKYKDDNWSDCEVVNYSYSWGEYSYKTRSRSDPEERANKVEDWDYFEEDTVTEFSQNPFKSSTTFENEMTEHYNKKAYKNFSVTNNKTANLLVDDESEVVDEIVSESKSKESSNAMCTTCNLIDNVNADSVDQNNWSNQNLHIPQNQNIQDDKEDWSDTEAYQSLQASFCEETQTGNYSTTFNSSRIDEEYWTDFDDDYESLQASFAEEYKSLDNTMEEENESTNTFTNKLFSFVKNEKVDDVFAPQQNGYQVNSLTSSIGSQSDETHVEDIEDYDYMIVDENERSESLPFAGQAVQEFLDLLDTMKHLPIQTQNIAVLHFISKQKEQAWQDQMQKET